MPREERSGLYTGKFTLQSIYFVLAEEYCPARLCCPVLSHSCLSSFCHLVGNKQVMMRRRLAVLAVLAVLTGLSAE